MPRLNEAEIRLNMHIFGYAKVRKTMWAMGAAAAGFNVLLLDGDGGFSVGVKTLTEEAKKRLYYINLQDKPDDFVFSKGVNTIFRATKPVFVDENTQVVGTLKSATANLQIDLRKTTLNDVVIVDSYTALVQSLFLYHSKEIGTLDKLLKSSWDDFKYAQDWSALLFIAMKALPCHFIMINHAAVMNSKTSTGDKQERLSPMGTSSNQSSSISRYFNEVFYFNALNEQVTNIATGGRSERDGGSRMIVPGNYPYWGTLTPPAAQKDATNFDFKTFCTAAGIKMPKDSPPSAGWVEIAK